MPNIPLKGLLGTKQTMQDHHRKVLVEFFIWENETIYHNVTDYYYETNQLYRMKYAFTTS